MLPKLRVIRDLSNSSKTTNSNTGNFQTNSMVMDIEDDETDTDNLPKLSTYRNDFRDRGIDVCMAKAYNILTWSKNKSAATADTA